jgi:hypothetical protein
LWAASFFSSFDVPVKNKYWLCSLCDKRIQSLLAVFKALPKSATKHIRKGESWTEIIRQVCKQIHVGVYVRNVHSVLAKWW